MLAMSILCLALFYALGTAVWYCTTKASLVLARKAGTFVLTAALLCAVGGFLVETVWRGGHLPISG